MSSESDLQRTIMQLLSTSPRVAFVRRLNSGKVRTAGGSYVTLGVEGDPDIIGMMYGRGRMFAIELKREGAKSHEHRTRQELQKQRLKEISDGGGLAFIAQSVDDVIRGLGL